MVDEKQALRILEDVGAIKRGHFLLTSGLHSDMYVDKFELLQRPEYAEKICRGIADRFAGQHVDVVLGPAMGGIIISYEVAKMLGARAFFAEREEGVLKLRRFKIEKGERVLVVEDIVTTGGSLREVLTLAEAAGADIVGVGVIVDRSGGKVQFPYRYEPLVRLQLNTYEQKDCPLCKEGVPIKKPGSRKLTP